MTGISLTKPGQTAGITKVPAGQLGINLNWDREATREADLDLGALWELTDGTKSVVQALGDCFGNFDGPPGLRLLNDDRSGANADGENLLVNLALSDYIKRLLVFAYIYEGASNWGEANGLVTITQPVGPQITVPLDGQGGDANFCAIALITNQGGGLVVQREAHFFRGNQQDLDIKYKWGLEWGTGRK